MKRSCASNLLEVTEGVSKNTGKEVLIYYGGWDFQKSFGSLLYERISPRMDNSLII